jgi:hypothetical protein
LLCSRSSAAESLQPSDAASARFFERFSPPLPSRPTSLFAAYLRQFSPRFFIRSSLCCPLLQFLPRFSSSATCAEAFFEFLPPARVSFLSPSPSSLAISLPLRSSAAILPPVPLPLLGSDAGFTLSACSAARVPTHVDVVLGGLTFPAATPLL